MKSDLIAYAMDLASFLVQKTSAKAGIRSLILFGSVARGEAERGSDVDVFADVVKENKAVESEIQKIAQAFRTSVKYRSYWKPLDVENEIQVTVGRLRDWKELEPGLIANGIVLYGKFKPEVKEGRHNTFFIWENIKPNAARVAFNKKLFGHRQGKRFYQGILQVYSAERVGKGCIVVPLEHATIFQQLFRKYKVNVRIRKVLEY